MTRQSQRAHSRLIFLKLDAPDILRHFHGVPFAVSRKREVPQYWKHAKIKVLRTKKVVPTVATTEGSPVCITFKQCAPQNSHKQSQRLWRGRGDTPRRTGRFPLNTIDTRRATVAVMRRLQELKLVSKILLCMYFINLYIAYDLVGR